MKLRGLTGDINEDDIRNTMRKFGEILKVKIPTEELRNGRFRILGFAFVTYRNMEDASKAFEEGEINVDIATLQIEQATRYAPTNRDRDQQNRNADFDTLKRRPF